MTQQYRVGVQWLNVARGRYTRGATGMKTFRAASLADACAKALTPHGGRINPAVYACWPVWPAK